MNDRYVTLNNYHQLMAIQNQNVRQCPFIFDNMGEEEGYYSEEEGTFSKIILHAFLTGSEISPPIPSTAVGTVNIFIDTDAGFFNVFVRAMHLLTTPIACDIYSLNDDDTIDTKLWSLPLEPIRSGYISRSIISLSENRAQQFLDYVQQKKAVVILQTEEFPSGELGGSLEIVFQWL